MEAGRLPFIEVVKAWSTLRHPKHDDPSIPFVKVKKWGGECVELSFSNDELNYFLLATCDENRTVPWNVDEYLRLCGDYVRRIKIVPRRAHLRKTWGATAAEECGSEDGRRLYAKSRMHGSSSSDDTEADSSDSDDGGGRASPPPAKKARGGTP